MKKLVVYLCVGVMAMALTACGGGDDQNNTQSTDQNQTVENQPAATDDAQGGNQTETPGTEDDTTAEEGTNGNYMDVSNGWSEEMSAIKAAVVEAVGEDYWPNTPIIPEMLEGTYGVTPDMYEDYMGEMPMISANVDTLLIVKAKSDKVDAVEQALTAYRENLVNDTMQYPSNLGKIQASRIERIGDYVCFVQMGAGAVVDEQTSEEQSIIKCQEQNELVIEIISQNVAH